MKRAAIGSLLFVGGMVALMALPSTEGSAMASSADAAEGEGPNRAAVEAPAAASASADDVETPANAGLKAAETPPPDLGGAGACPANMVEVEGDYCPALEQKCVRWMDPETTIPRRCSEFAPTGACQGKTIKKHFCIDRFEYPNKVGEKPVIMKTWYEAGDACKAQGKRLCGDSEWTLACEGQERLPYPYGLERNSEACNIDKPHPDVNEVALGSGDPKVRDAEAQRLWQGEPSGTRESCVSPFGVHDMTGNVDEWVVNESAMPYKSGLKGGYWGPVRDRCRPMTTAHNEQFSFYQIGFRCCEEPAAAGAKVDPGSPSGASPASNTAPGAKAPASPQPLPSTVAGI